MGGFLVDSLGEGGNDSSGKDAFVVCKPSCFLHCFLWASVSSAHACV